MVRHALYGRIFNSPAKARLDRGGNRMYAVIKTGGKQYRVSAGDVITVEKLGVAPGERVEFSQVLACGEGDSLEVGSPFVEGCKVYGEVIENGKGKKVVIFKYKAKKDYRKKQGHRQPYTMVKILSIGEEPKEAPVAKAETKEEVKKVNASMKKDELIAYAKEKGITVDEKATKAIIIQQIEDAEK